MGMRTATARAMVVGAILLASAREAHPQTTSPPVLTIDDAVALALAGNRRVEATARDVDRAHEATAATKTARLPQFQTYLLAGESLRPLEFSIPRGALGVFPATGPIPADDATVTTPRELTGFVVGQVTQPLSQLWKVHLAVAESEIGERVARETARQQQADAARAVRELYFQIAQTQARVDSAASSVAYLEDLQRETDRQLGQQTALQADSLAVKARLSQQRYALLTLRDALDTQKESLNRLMGRAIDTSFVVSAQPPPSAAEIDLAAARREALEARADVQTARLQASQAQTAIRRQRAEYLPDVSLHLTYFSTMHVSFAPRTIVQAGVLLQWQPFDWGQKRHTIASLAAVASERSLAEQDVEAQVTIEVNTAFRQLAEARAKLDAAVAAQDAARERRRVVSNQFTQQSALRSDVLQQDAAVAQADADYQDALGALWIAKADFDHALGRN